jgi:excisionase family DNA binding protein
MHELRKVTTPSGRSREGTTTRGGEENVQAYTVEQVAEILHISRDRVYFLLRTRQLRSLKIGKLRRITDEQLAEFIASAEGNTA